MLYKVTPLPLPGASFPIQSRGGLARLQSSASTREMPLLLRGMCPRIQDKAWNPQQFRKAKRKMSHLLLSTEAGSKAHLLQCGIRVAQPGARRGVGGVAMCQHLLLCGNNHLQQFAPAGPPALESSGAEELPVENPAILPALFILIPQSRGCHTGAGYPPGGPAGQAFPCHAV